MQFVPLPVKARFLTHPLYTVLGELRYNARHEWAWENYRKVIEAYARMLAEANRENDVHLVPAVEVGGGRAPLFTVQEASALGLDITVNDIDAAELSRAPPGFRRASYDIAGKLPSDERDRYQLCFSRMVFEHVNNAHVAWRNVYEILKPDGLAIAFIPTLYATPFLINRVLPETISTRILSSLFPSRNIDAIPKFPAKYDWCVASTSLLTSRLRRIGFREVLVLPFWTHNYFARIPILRSAEQALQLLARKLDLRFLSSYAYVVARK
jgi:SAM-dependent methyltransferase